MGGTISRLVAGREAQALGRGTAPDRGARFADGFWPSGDGGSA